VALLERHLLGRTHIGQGQHDVRGLALEADAADHGANAMPEQPAERAADIGALRIAIAVRNVGHQHIVGRLHLSLADIGADALLATGGQLAFGLGRSQSLAAIHQREALGLRHVHLDQCGGRIQLHRRPPLVLRLGHRQRADLLVADRNLRLRAGISSASRRAGRCGSCGH
jgi:hypothetical protein